MQQSLVREKQKPHAGCLYLLRIGCLSFCRMLRVLVTGFWQIPSVSFNPETSVANPGTNGKQASSVAQNKIKRTQAVADGHQDRIRGAQPRAAQGAGEGASTFTHAQIHVHT